MVIADQARMRWDFTPIETSPELVSTLQLLTGYRDARPPRIARPAA